MYQDNLFAIDLSKTSLQGCLLDKFHHERFNRHFTRGKAIDWLARQQPLSVAMEACGSAHHWARLVERMGPSSSAGTHAYGNRKPGLLRQKPLSSKPCRGSSVFAHISATSVRYSANSA